MCHPLNTLKYQPMIQSNQQDQQDRNRTNDPATQGTETSNDVLVPSMTLILTSSQTMESDFISPPGLVAEIDDGIKTSLIEAEEERILNKKLTWKNRMLKRHQWRLKSFFNNEGQIRKSQHIFIIYGIFCFITIKIARITIHVST